MKGKLSLVVYVVVAVLLSFRLPRFACSLYALVAVMWLIPDPRIEKKFMDESHSR